MCASEREDENAHAEEENTSVVVPSETFVTYINKELFVIRDRARDL